MTKFSLVLDWLCEIVTENEWWSLKIGNRREARCVGSANGQRLSKPLEV